MWQIVAPLRGAMGSGSVTVKHTTSSMRQYVAPPSGDNLWITRPPSGGYILCQCDITSHRLRRAYYILCLGSWFTYYILCQCDKMSHRPAGGTISSGTTSSAPFGGHGTTYSAATKCRTALRAVGGGILYLVASLRSAYYM